jgi:hypothetical protein
MRGKDPHLVRDPEGAKLPGALLHRLQVAVRSHYDANYRFGFH